MKDQAVHPAVKISLAVFALWAGGGGLGRWMLSLAGRLGIMDFPSAVGGRRAVLVRPLVLDKKAPGMMSRPLRGCREKRGRTTAAPPAAEACTSKAVEACGAVQRFVSDVRETEPETGAVAEELREARVRERGSPKLSEPVRVSLERAQRRRSGRRRAWTRWKHGTLATDKFQLPNLDFRNVSWLLECKASAVTSISSQEQEP